MHNRRIIALALVFISAYPADAATIKYKCLADGKTLYAKIDDTNNTLAWKRKTFKLTETDECAKFGWRAERNGEGFNFCTATQGYAEFQEGGKLIRCDQSR
ncbi:hypothetical protein MKK75_19710 [Methylobacterium sp. J-030]|uniref:hypothetical protein n=1 Tax=Methylobacterium sp. J-030 TaxID=2836627 RepID=UPI001FBB9D92|nr:hypothetical protein [Methylobacterium sp. J-030]MCJ2070988.1 hypothetical protein [Methylobacterium sp. J-030]